MSTTESIGRVARKRERVRQRILEVTAELVRSQGLPLLTMDALAEAADISKPSLYYYFSSKDEVLRSLSIDMATAEVNALLAAIDATPRGGSTVDAMLRAYVAFHGDALHLFRATYVHSQTIDIDPDRMDVTINASMNRFFDRFSERLEQDLAGGFVFPSVHPRRTAFTTWVAGHGLIATFSLLDAHNVRLRQDAGALVDQLCENLSRGVYRAATTPAA